MTIINNEDKDYVCDCDDVILRTTKTDCDGGAVRTSLSQPAAAAHRPGQTPTHLWRPSFYQYVDIGKSFLVGSMAVVMKGIGHKQSPAAAERRPEKTFGEF